MYAVQFLKDWTCKNRHIKFTTFKVSVEKILLVSVQFICIQTYTHIPQLLQLLSHNAQKVPANLNYSKMMQSKTKISGQLHKGRKTSAHTHECVNRHAHKSMQMHTSTWCKQESQSTDSQLLPVNQPLTWVCRKKSSWGKISKLQKSYPSLMDGETQSSTLTPLSKIIPG